MYNVHVHVHVHNAIKVGTFCTVVQCIDHFCMNNTAAIFLVLGMPVPVVCSVSGCSASRSKTDHSVDCPSYHLYGSGAYLPAHYSRE